MSKSDLNRFPERLGMKAAIEAAKAEKRAPDKTDAPPPSTFPPTPASREAERKPQAERLWS